MNKLLIIFAVCILLEFTAGSPVFSKEKAPSFQTEDYKGNPINSDSYLGKHPTILIFWAQWCVLCRQEIPKLKALYRKYAGYGLKVLSVNRDNLDDKDKAAKYADKVKFPFPVILKTKRIHYKYKAITIPFIVLIDKNGFIIERAYSLDTIESALATVIGRS